MFRKVGVGLITLVLVAAAFIGFANANDVTNDTDNNRQLVLNVFTPHIQYYWLNATTAGTISAPLDGAGTPAVNAQGDTNEIWNLTVMFLYDGLSIPGGVQSFDAFFWYDEANDAVNNNYTTPALGGHNDTTAGGNRNMHIRVSAAAPNGFMKWPRPNAALGGPGNPGDEASLIGVTNTNGAFSSRAYAGGYSNGVRQTVSIEFTPGPQMWFADGGGALNPPGAPGTEFNDADSWNMQLFAYDDPAGWIGGDFDGNGIHDSPGVDDSVGASSKWDEGQDEFGIFKLVTVDATAASDPTGSGRPGQTVTLAPSCDVAYTANVDYDFGVFTQDLTGPGPNIPVTAVETQSITGADLAWAAFTVSNPGVSDLYYLGGNGVGDEVPRIANGASTGAEGGATPNPANDYQTSWRVTVPGGQPEGTYTAAITFVIDCQ